MKDMASDPQGFEAFFILGSNFLPEEREMNHAFISRRHYSWRHVVSFRIRPPCPR
jgi:hypothetical protein